MYIRSDIKHNNDDTMVQGVSIINVIISNDKIMVLWFIKSGINDISLHSMMDCSLISVCVHYISLDILWIL